MNKVIFELKDGTTKEFDGEKFTDEHIEQFSKGRCDRLSCEECPFYDLYIKAHHCITGKGFDLYSVASCYRVTEDPKPIQILKRLIEGGSVWVDGEERKLEHLIIASANAYRLLGSESVTLEKPKKKIKVERWLNVYPSSVITHDSKESADNDASKDRIACEHFVKEYEV